MDVHDDHKSPARGKLEVGHVLFMDLVGYSRLMIEEQKRTLDELQKIVRELHEFVAASEENRLIRLPTGDGMALVFFGDPEAPLRAAVELSRALRDHATLKLRMGIHAGPVYRVEDINANMNVAGGGVNVAQRVMDCGDAGHILVSEDSAKFFAQVGEWADRLHDIGKTRVKHGVRLHLYSLFVSEVGNAALPRKIRSERLRRRTVATFVVLGVVVAGMAYLWWRITAHPRHPIVTQITSNAASLPLNAAAISPNGQYLAYEDPKGIHVRDMQSGEDKPLPAPEGAVLSSPDWALAWFHDSSRLLASGPAGGDKFEGLWLFHPFVGPPPKRIAEKAESPNVASDDSRIAYIDAETESTIWGVSPEGGDRERILDAPQGNSFDSICWSPKGARLAFLELAPDPDDDFIGTVDASEGVTSQTKVSKGDYVSGPEEEEFYGLVWLADGRIIFVRPNEQASKGSNLWGITVDSESGQATGSPTQITEEVDVFQSDLSSTKDGKRLAFLRARSHTEVYLGNLDGTGKAFTKFGEFISEESNNSASSWTANSKSLLFISDRNGGTEGTFEQALTGEGGAALAFGGDAPAGATALSDAAGYMYWSWSKDQGDNPKYISLKQRPSEGAASLTLLNNQPVTSQFRCAMAKPTCLISDESEDGLAFSRLDIRGGSKKFLAKLKLPVADGYDWDISPDGGTIAAVHTNISDHTIRILTLADGVTQGLPVAGRFGFDRVSWSADGSGLYLTVNIPRYSALVRADLRGHVDVVWQSQSATIGAALPSPDGEHIAFTVESPGESNAWIIERF